MSGEYVSILILGAIVLGLNSLASIRCVRANRGALVRMGAYVDDPKSRRRLQLLLVWLVPLIGAITILALYSKPRRRPGPGSNDPMGPTGMELYTDV